MSTKLPIAMALKAALAGGAPMVLNAADGSGQFVVPSMGMGLSNAVFFDVQVANDIFMAQWKSRRFAKDYVARLPFPSVWLEWKDEAMGRDVACLIEEANPIQHRDAKSGGLHVLLYTIPEDSIRPKLHPMSGVVDVDDDGTVTHVEFGTVVPSGYDEKTLDEFQRITDLYLHTAFTALGLVNCNNVTTKEERLRLRRSGTQKRRGMAATEVRYRTIVLPGGGSEPDGRGGHRATAIHRVRGHFKTYTAERPLMGRGVGTYWWGWQVRGSAALGAVESDYRLT